MLKFKKTILLLVLLICGFSAAVQDGDIEAAKINCEITRKCSTSEEIVWAVDDHDCHVFRNPCIFGTEMCKRRAANENELKVVSRAECKEKCHDFCTEEFFPVCTEYKEAYETFSNRCEFRRKSCQEDKSYIFLHNGKCE